MGHCYWKKQPETHEELRQAFAIFDGQELGCHRYAGYDPKIQERLAIFEGTPEEVFNAAVLAAQKHWNVTQTDRPTMTLSFTTGTSVRTWGMDCSVLIEGVPGGKTQVTVHMQKKNQVYAWNVGESIAKKFFDGIEDELSKARAAAKPNSNPALKPVPLN